MANRHPSPTPRLIFREWTADDLPYALELWGDPEVTRRIGGPFSREDVERKLAGEIATAASYGVQYWPVFHRDQFVGCCGLRPYLDDIHELGVHVRRSQWGNGFAEEACRGVMAFAFDELNVARLFAGHHPENEASRHLLAKLGFRYVRDELYAPTGLMHPSYLLERR